MRNHRKQEHDVNFDNFSIYLGDAPRVVAIRQSKPAENAYGPMDGSAVALELSTGKTLNVTLGADCCSVSSFTDAKQFDELVGATITDIEHREGGEIRDGYSDDCRTSHFLVFTTNRGHVTIDWHNDSNGYYDGWAYLSVVETGAEPKGAAR
jgi:hypothetical protein